MSKYPTLFISAGAALIGMSLLLAIRMDQQSRAQEQKTAIKDLQKTITVKIAAPTTNLEKLQNDLQLMKLEMSEMRYEFAKQLPINLTSEEEALRQAAQILPEQTEKIRELPTEDLFEPTEKPQHWDVEPAPANY